MHLRSKLGAAQAGLGHGNRDGRAHQRPPDSSATVFAQHANADNLGSLTVYQEARAPHRVGAKPCQYVQRLRVATIDLQRGINVLLVNEHNAAQGMAGRQIIGQTHRQHQAK